ncbi:MAG: hypothetical protein KatS3mg031_0232 [Chitinophagales bacterium]|nr:MAG: hypothetical protein KatS3mg031_0232 [Chitinophagales bacterium]
MQETKTRSLVKGISWRVVGTADTIMLSWLITGSVEKALHIGGLEVVTKTILFFLHERVWLMIKLRDPNSRLKSLSKAISWRIIGTLDTIVISFLVITFLNRSDPLKVPAVFQASTIGLTELFTKIVLFYIHERLWNRIPYGKKHDQT